ASRKIGPIARRVTGLGHGGPSGATTGQPVDQQIRGEIREKTEGDGDRKDPGSAGGSQPARNGFRGEHERKTERESHPPGEGAGPAAREGRDGGDDEGQKCERGGPEHQVSPSGEPQHHSTTISATSPPNSLVIGRSPGGACQTPPSTRT